MPVLNTRTPSYSPQPRYQSVYDGFPGGLNLYYTPTEIQKTELVQADNCMLIGAGVVTGRWGSQTYFSTGSTTIRMLEKYENLNTSVNELLVVTDTGYLRKKSGTSTTVVTGVSFASGAIVNSTQIANYQYLVSSSTKFSRYDGTNVSVYNGISAPASVTVAYVSGATGTATWSYRITAFSKTLSNGFSSTCSFFTTRFISTNFSGLLLFISRM